MNEHMTTDALLEAFRKMLLIRWTETTIADDFRANKIFSFYHSSVGQEAVAVGACSAMQSEDRVFGNHRSHAHYLAKGGNLYRMLCEIYGKEDGCCGGYGGSMHMLDRTAGFMGSTPILASAVPIAVGSAFEQKISKSTNITTVFVGDGASEEGAFYESLNLAATLQLPIVFVLEDNLYAVNSPQTARRAKGFVLKDIVLGLGCWYGQVNGNSFEKMYDKFQESRQLAAEGRPTVIHAKVFRHMAHSGPIKDESVRVVDTETVRHDTDPILLMHDTLRSRGIAEDHLMNIITDVKSQLMEAFAAMHQCATPQYSTEKTYAR